MNKKDIVSSTDSEMVNSETSSLSGKRRERNIPWSKIILTITLLVTIAGALFSTKTLSDVNKNIAAAKEASRPANIKIIKITTPNCTDCFNVNDAISVFKKLNVRVEEEKTLIYGTPEASASIKQYVIKKVPTYLVTGEVQKNNLTNFVTGNGEVKNNTYIFTKLLPIFINTETGLEMGKVTATLITDASCPQCVDPKTIIENFKKAGINVKELKELTWNSYDAKNIINKYKITKIPSIIFSPELDIYDSLKNSWTNFGTVEQDKSYVTRNLPLPYRDLTKGQIVGLVDLIYLTDSGCTDCYKVSDVQKPILTKGYGVIIRSERTVDITSQEGKNLIALYKITKVPTILLSPDADYYSNIKNVWKSVGIIGIDGWYVFTRIEQLGNSIYKDLTNNQIIRPAQQPSPTSTK